MCDTVNRLDMGSSSEWQPLDFVYEAGKKFALVMLNGELRLEQGLLVHLWTKAALRLTVDGGTNLWLAFVDALPDSAEVISPTLPDLVTGDMDSITPETLGRCEGISHIEYTPDQDKTDFTKALEFMTSYLERKSIKVDYIVVLGEPTGRIDQTLSNLNTLYTCDAEKTTKGVPVFLMSSNSLTWLLNRGAHKIYVSEEPKIKSLTRKADNDWLALIPLGHPCNQVLKFGGLISSSNTYGGEPIITVQTDHPLIWSMGLAAREKRT